MTIKAFGSKTWGLNEDDAWEKLTELGFMRPNGYPKAKYIKEGIFDENCQIVDAKKLKQLIAEAEDGDEDDAEEKPVKGKGKKAKEESSDEALTVKDLEEVLLNQNFKSRDEIGSLINILVDKMKTFDESTTSDSEEEEEEEDPNREGKYRGWTISLNGKKVTASKKGRSLECSIKGNIRELIDEEED